MFKCGKRTLLPIALFPPFCCDLFTGSVAAGLQAGMGNVIAGSLFAGAQSVAAGGALPAVGYVIAGGVSGVVGFFGGR